MNRTLSKIVYFTDTITELYGLNTTNNGRIVLFGGGIPLTQDEKVVGAVGVSGSSVEHDIQVAQAAVNVFESLKVSVGN